MVDFLFNSPVISTTVNGKQSKLNPQSKNTFFIKDWWVSPDEGLLKKGDDVVHLEPKTMEMLVYFAARQGEVITRDEFEKEVWHGTLIGYDAITGTVIKLRKALQDNARNPDFIATIPKRGYQLIASVRYEENVNNCLQDTEIDTKPIVNAQKSKYMQIAILGMLCLGLVLVWHLLQSPSDSVKSKQTSAAIPSIAVLPFENLSNDPKQDYLAVGITEDIVIDLSRLPGLMVISSNASNIYKDTDIQLNEIGKELNVEYILKGSVRPLGNLIRVNAQLINTSTGINLWGNSYDREIVEVFAIQSEVTGNIVSAFDLQLSTLERQRLTHKTTNNLIAYDHFQEGQRLSKLQTKESHLLARQSYRKAIEADPNYGRPYGSIAYLLAYSFRRGWTDAPIETLDRALNLAKKGIELDNSIPQTYWSLGYVYMMRQEYENAQKAVTQAINIAPSYADGYGLLALIYNNMGRPQKAIDHATKGMRLNPYYTWDYLYNLGRAYYTKGHYKKAIDVLEKARERNENAIPIRLVLATSYINTGRQDDAEWEIEQIQMLNPNETITHTKQSIPISNEDLMNAFLSDLRKAGLPE